MVSTGFHVGKVYITLKWANSSCNFTLETVFITVQFIWVNLLNQFQLSYWSPAAYWSCIWTDWHSAFSWNVSETNLTLILSPLDKVLSCKYDSETCLHGLHPSMLAKRAVNVHFQTLPYSVFSLFPCLSQCRPWAFTLTVTIWVGDLHLYCCYWFVKVGNLIYCNSILTVCNQAESIKIYDNIYMTTTVTIKVSNLPVEY